MAGQIGPYRLDEELGRGAMGIVYRGFEPAIGRAVAVKIILPRQFSNPGEDAQMRQRFAREAAAAGTLSHDNIVVIYRLEEESGVQYIAMEFVEGRSLEQMLAPGTPLETQAALSILSQIAGALDYAHAKGIVHRDIKPANILVRSDGRTKITDFGIARIASQTITETGITMGTPSYMAPEQIRGAKVDGNADQFSLAVMAYQMLSGRKPFEADNGQALMYRIVNEETAPLNDVNVFLPPACAPVVRRALAKNPDQRYPTCSAFVQALRESLGWRKGPEAAGTRTMTAAAKGQSPRRLLASFGRTILMAVGAVTCVALAIFGYSLYSSKAGSGAAKDAPLPTSLPPPHRAGELTPNARDGLNYVWIPAGAFQMGCSLGDSECYDDEKPAHDRTITKGFWLGQVPVTQAAYQRVKGEDPSIFKGANLPVEGVNWEEARDYCKAISGRLPTENEWEYAARAGSTNPYYGPLNLIAWYDGNSRGRPHDVGQKQANAWNLYDMLGNVWQWTADWYDTGGTYRVLRGGSWDDDPRFVRVSSRYRVLPGLRNNTIGFRCAAE